MPLNLPNALTLSRIAFVPLMLVLLLGEEAGPIPAAAAASGGKITTLYGGVPIEVDGQIVGAVGVGGATGEQDSEIARAGIAALLKALETPKEE